MEMQERSAAMPDYVWKAMFVLAGFVLLGLVYDVLKGTGKKLLRGLLHALAGLAGLLTANTLGSLIGVGLGVNPVTGLVAAALGLPGVGLMFALRYLLFA